MTQARNGDTVRVHYTGRLEDGTVFDASTGQDPLEFTIGQGQIIPAFEQALIGMNLDESKTIHIPAEDAYGPHREEMVLVVDRARFPAHIQPEIGLLLSLRQPDGRTVDVAVTAVSESSVTLDANHPLAGKDLTFHIQLVEIV